MTDSVCAVVITYHPQPEDFDNLVFIREQVQYAVIVDNASDEHLLLNLREKCQRLDIHLIENDANLGIAVALNTGIRWAISKGSKWVALFDQDSKPDPGFVEKLLLDLVSHSGHEKFGIMVPALVDARSNRPLDFERTKTGELLAVQTSGSVMPTIVFEQEGWFDEGFFIDCVDYDYCLRIKDRGWKFEQCTDASLRHKPASFKEYRVLGCRIFEASNYNATRRYYRTRNKIWMFRRHWKTHLSFCLHLNWSNMKDLIKIIAEQNRREKWRAASRGFIDGICGQP
jgi:rhamnosyltransferase